jgi:hypothetical protein
LAQGIGFEFGADWCGRKRPQVQQAGYFSGLLSMMPTKGDLLTHGTRLFLKIPESYHPRKAEWSSFYLFKKKRVL